MKMFQELVATKRRRGFLSGQDALDALRYIRASGEEWTEEALEQLTAFMLARPVKPGFKFQVIAGTPIEQITQLEEDAGHDRPMRSCLGCGKKFAVSRKQENRAFHSDECHAKQTEKLMRSGIMPSGWKVCAVCCGPFLPEFGTEKYCKRKACSRDSARQNARTGRSLASEPA
jgi:hypothetical protein